MIFKNRDEPTREIYSYLCVFGIVAYYKLIKYKGIKTSAFSVDASDKNEEIRCSQ